MSGKYVMSAEPFSAVAIGKILAAIAGCVVSVVSIGKAIKWLQGPAAENKDALEHLKLDMGSMRSEIAILGHRITELQNDNQETTTEFRETRKEIRLLRNELLDLAVGRSGE